MTQAAALSKIDPPRFGVRDAGLWAGAATLVLVAHVAVAYVVQNFAQVDAPDGGSPPALAIEMSPLVAAPAVEEDAPVPDTVMPDQAESVEETVAEVKPVTEPEPTVEEAVPAAERPVQFDEAEPTAASVAALSDQPPLGQVAGCR
jgi:protein TonB